MTAEDFTLGQLGWLRVQYEKAQDTETRERLITAIEDIVIAALGERVFPSAYKELPP